MTKPLDGFPNRLYRLNLPNLPAVGFVNSLFLL
jgi:hypothetical protein